VAAREIPTVGYESKLLSRVEVAEGTMASAAQIKWKLGFVFSRFCRVSRNGASSGVLCTPPRSGQTGFLRC
jgi:hypothetical protein